MGERRVSLQRRPGRGARMQYRWSYVATGERHEWLLRRNCALSPQQLGCCFAGLGAVSMAIAALFAIQGAWMVLPFSCIELTGLALAFLAYGRHAADYEKIVAADGLLSIETGIGGRVRRVERALGLVRVAYRGARRGEPVVLMTGADSLAVGRHVPDGFRGRFAQELREALGLGGVVRGGVRLRPDTVGNGFA